MNGAAKVSNCATTRGTLGLFMPPEVESNVARWRINGHPAVVVVWTSEEWERLDVRPADAQYYPCGVWCALRIE